MAPQFSPPFFHRPTLASENTTPNVMVAHQHRNTQGTKVPFGSNEGAEKVNGSTYGRAETPPLHFCIRPLSTLSRAEVAALASAAADRGEPLAAANPFERGTQQHTWFTRFHEERDWELRPVAA